MKLVSRLGLGLWLLVLAPPGTADFGAFPMGRVQCSAERQQQLDAIVERKLRDYSREFPDIGFVVLSSRASQEFSLAVLLQLLGEGAANLDYEHPPELRADLLAASLKRIEILLRTSSSSSALFRIGRNGLTGRGQLCVLTLDTCNLASDDTQATHYMLKLPTSVIHALPDNRYLDADRHLEYVIDHEVHHCLQAHRGDPIPMSRQVHWPGYMQRRNEIAADAYGLAMHLLTYGVNSSYANSLIAMRGLSLLEGDPDHYTPLAMTATLKTICEEPDPGSTVHHALSVADTVRGQIDQGYEDYLKYRYAAYQTMKRLGIEDDAGAGVLVELPGYSPEPERVENLLRETSMHYQTLFGEPMPGVTQPPAGH